jgi:hypothetical protein
MTRALLPILLLLAAFSLPHDVLAADTSSGKESIHVAVGLQAWLSRADAQWQISFTAVTPSGQALGRVESQLIYNKIDSPMAIITGGMGIGPDFSFDGLIGMGSIGNGTSTDIDRIISNSGSGTEFSKSTSDVHDDVALWEINLYYNNHRYGNKGLGPWGAVFGYTHYQDKLTMTNGIQIIPPFGPFSQLNSTYDFYWDAVKFGVLPQFDVTDRLSITGMLAFYPFVRYRGDAYWNLRTAAFNDPNPFRAESPNFVHKSTSGYGGEASLGLTYGITKQLELTAGYRYLYLYAKDGTDTTYFADGSVSTANLDWATITRQGATIEVVVKF